MSTAHRIVRLNGTGTGSGYVIAPRLVLTSAHVVPGSGGVVAFFTATDDTVYTGRVVWRGTPHGRDDAALVEVTDPAWPVPPARVRWGRLVTHTPGTACHTWGYPDVAQQPGQAVETSQPAGTINPGNHFLGNHHIMDITAHPPRWDQEGSPWGGLSGAALVCGDLVVGVVAADPTHSGHARLETVPAYVLHHDPAFRAVLEEHGASQVLEPVELANLSHRQRSHRSRISPASLLEAHRRVVSFHGREELMDTLITWCEGAQELSAVVVHGPGGQGKTRLAHELTHRLDHTTPGPRWATLWLTDPTDPSQLDSLARVQVPLLVVVDYAESRTAQLTDLLRVCERDPGSPPIRLLLLTRTVGEWWDQVNTDTGHLLTDITDRTIALPSLAPARVEREHEYHTALHQLANALPEADTPVSADWTTAAADLATPELFADEWKTVLSVHMRALADLLDATQPPPETARAGRNGPVEARVLGHEQVYWKRTAAGYGIQMSGVDPGWQNTVLEQVLAVAFTRTPTTVEEADALLGAMPVLADQATALRQRIRRWVCELYPNEGTGLWGTVHPDRLLEYFLAEQLLKNPGLFDPHMEGIARLDSYRWVSLLARASAHANFSPRLGELVSDVCVRFASVLGPVTVDVVTRTEHPDPLIEALKKIVNRPATTEEIILKLTAASPLFSHRLAEWSMQASTRLVEMRRERDQNQSGVHLPALAASLHNQAVRLGDLGRHEEALKVVTEAVHIRQALAQKIPDIYLPDLAKSLNNQAVDLGNLGRHEEALESLGQALLIRQKLAQEDPDTHLPFLAESLNGLGNRLGDLGKSAQALDALGRAVRIRRSLARKKTETYLADLATSLNNMAARLAEIGQIEESLSAITEAVGIRRKLAQQNPDSYLRLLATSLNNQALDLADLGRHERALDIISEAVFIRRGLANDRPDAFQPELATSLHNQAAILFDLRRHEEALGSIVEAIEIRQHFARIRPVVYLKKLESSHELHAHLKDSLGQIDF